MKNKNLEQRFYFLTATLIFAFAVSISAQTTAFTYQGKLSDGGSAASGNYLLEFKLFDAASGGTQIGSTVSNVFVTATQGVFTTKIDFGATPFSGADRFLEIAVKKTAGDPYTVLTPRQQIASSPYSIRTLSAAQADVALDSQKLGGKDASEYVTTSSVGNSFIKNSTTQQTADFNVSGNGIVGGNLGIGRAPDGGYRLDVVGAARINPQGGIFTGTMQFGTPAAETGMSIIDNNRADVRFDGLSLKLLANAGTGAPASTSGLAVSTTGSVGVGTTNPQTRFQVQTNTNLFGFTHTDALRRRKENENSNN